MNLDELARDAADELRARTLPDPVALLDDLRRTRTRRNLQRVAGVAAALLLVGGSVALVRVDRRADAPTHPVGPGGVGNGAIVAGNRGGLELLAGHLDHLPRNAAPYSMVQFTQDGSELIYALRSHGGLVTMNVTSGAVRRLAPCRITRCSFSQVSPDGTRVAETRTVGGQNGVEVRSVASGRTTFLPTHGPVAGWPRWSPDGRSLVFSDSHGLYLMPVDGGRARLLHRYPSGTSYGLPASWSPDGSTIAFLEPRPVRAKPPVNAWTLTTVRRDGTGLRSLREVGACYCIGIPPPAVAWSPDGRQIAVTVIHTGRSIGAARSDGLYAIHPDGTGWTLIEGGVGAGMLTWQPLPGQGTPSGSHG
jgi:WD40-like Beta Propeller Repeat